MGVWQFEGGRGLRGLGAPGGGGWRAGGDGGQGPTANVAGRPGGAAGSGGAADRLVEVLWGDQLPPGAGGGLTKVVYRLRTLLAGGPAGSDRQLIVTRSPGYVLDVPAEWVDAGRFEGLLRQAQATRRAGDPPPPWRCLMRHCGCGGVRPWWSSPSRRSPEARRPDWMNCGWWAPRSGSRSDWRSAITAVRRGPGRPGRRPSFPGALVGAAHAGVVSSRPPERSAARPVGSGSAGRRVGHRTERVLRSLEEAILLQKPELDWPAASAPDQQPPAVAQARRETATGRAADPGAVSWREGR